MKKLLLVSLIAGLMGSAAVAQDTKAGPNQKPTVEQKNAKKADMTAARAEWEKKVKDELKLTPDQAVKFDALNKDYNAKIDAVVQDANLDKEVQKEKKMALKKEKEAKLFEILTPEQQVAYKELIDKKKKEMEAKPAN